MPCAHTGQKTSEARGAKPFKNISLAKPQSELASLSLLQWTNWDPNSQGNEPLVLLFQVFVCPILYNSSKSHLPYKCYIVLNTQRVLQKKQNFNCTFLFSSLLCCSVLVTSLSKQQDLIYCRYLRYYFGVGKIPSYIKFSYAGTE